MEPEHDLYLLAVGVSQFQDRRLEPLEFADDDATAIAEWADTQRGRQYRDVHVKLLTDQQANRRTLIDALLGFARSAGPRDQILVFLAGHGIISTRSGTYHFLTHDTDLDSIEGTALEQHDLLAKLRSSPTPHNRVLVLIDTCHAAAVVEDEPGLQTRGLKLSGAVGQIDARVLDQDTSVWAVFSAGTALEKAPEGPQYRLDWDPPSVKGHGLFSHALLRALGTVQADASREGTVSLKEMDEFVTRVVREESGGQLNPVMYGRTMDVELAWAVGTPEVCDGLDNNRDGLVDESFPDMDGDRVPDCLEQERCNGIDDNGDGRVDEGFDLDGDGHRSLELCGTEFGDDCDDTNLSIHPGQRDWDNFRDDNCNGLHDEDGFDLDADGRPDGLERRLRQHRVTSLVSLGAGVAFLGAGLSSYARLVQLRTDVVESHDPISSGELAQYQRLSAWTIGWLSAATVSLGVSGTFGYVGRRFRLEHLPRQRELEIHATR